MRSSNPVLTGRGFARISPDVFDREATSVNDVTTLESRPSAAPMSIDDVIIKTAAMFAVLVAVGVFAWQAANPAFALIGVVAGLGFALVNSFSKKVRPAFVLAYAAAEGLALGTISQLYEGQ